MRAIHVSVCCASSRHTLWATVTMEITLLKFFISIISGRLKHYQENQNQDQSHYICTHEIKTSRVKKIKFTICTTTLNYNNDIYFLKTTHSFTCIHSRQFKIKTKRIFLTKNVSKLDLCECGSDWKTVFKSDTKSKIIVYHISCFISVCPFVVLPKMCTFLCIVHII